MRTDISGAISHDRFLKLSAEYEAEQRELEEKVKADQQGSPIPFYEQTKATFDSFGSDYPQLCGGNQFPFLPRNRNGKAHKENALVERKKRRYSPCNWGYTA